MPLEINYFKKVILDGFALTVLFEFITGLFTFNLITEILLIPIITIIYVSYIYLEYSDKEPKLQTFFSKILTFLLLIFLMLTIIVAIEKYPSLNIIQIFVEFFIPIIFSILYIPAIYLFGVYGKYDLIFVRIGENKSINQQIKDNYKKKIFLAYGLSYQKLLKFEEVSKKEMHYTMSYKEFNDLILKIKSQ